jgi:hypothetical protein
MRSDTLSPMMFAFGGWGRAFILAGAVCGVLGTVACGAQPARPEPAAAPTYRSALPPPVRDQLAQADRIRALDACGFVDRAAADRLGTVDYFGAGPWPSDGDLDQCDVVFDPAAQSPPITVQLGLPGVPAPIGNRTLIGDATIYVSSGYGCRAQVPTDSMTITYAGARDCPTLMQVVSASAPLLRDRPARPPSKLAGVDPCEVLAHAPNMTSAPHPPTTGLAASCRTDNEMITLGYRDFENPPQPGASMIDGIPVTVSPDPANARNCVADVYFGFAAPHTVPRGGPTGDVVFEEFASITGFGRDCRSVEADATKLVDSYRHVN